MALHSFKAEIAGGKINVTADPANTTSANKSRQPKLLATGSSVASAQGKGVVIVGGGSGAFNCIESLREVRYDVAVGQHVGSPLPLARLQRPYYSLVQGALCAYR